MSQTEIEWRNIVIYLLSRIGFQISFNVKQSCEIDRFFRFLSMGFESQCE